MEIALNKNEKIIAAVSVVVISVFFMMFLLINNSHKSISQVETQSNINYQMARPDESYSEYSLSGREVDSQYDAVKAKEIAKAKEVAKTNAAALKKVDAKKKDAPPKQPAVAAAVSKPKAQPPVANAVKKEANQSSKVDSAKTQSTDPQFNNMSNGNLASDNSQPQQAPQQDPTAKSKKTFAQWRTLIFSQPTREVLATFIEAYRKNEVTSAEYQSMAQDLLDQDNEQYKSLGLVALRAQPSLQSLSQLVHIESTLSATYQAYVEASYLTYLQPQYVSIFNQAMATSDKTLITKSLQILSTNLQKFTQGDYSTLVGARNVRDGESVSLSMSSYKVLLTGLSSLSSSQDQSISSLAQQVAGYIQSTNNVAQN